ncbi:MAG: DUF2961 domain-containing protein [Planctomycetes bacterium]|nr:DUF2961 domain-containing protein [Planctomycetota bacterium]
MAAPLLLCALLAELAAQAPVVDVAGLRAEDSALEELARWPSPEYTLSRSTRVLRVEEPSGRREHVLAECTGAGSFVRLHLATPAGKLRLYAADAPVLELDAAQALREGSNGPALPFARGAKLTLECESEPVFEIAWRSYVEGTSVRDAVSGRPAVPKTPGGEGGRAPSGELSFTISLAQQNPAGDFLATDPRLAKGPRAVSELVLRADGADPELALRGLVLHIAFDGEETVVCPVTAFFRALESEPRLRLGWTKDLGARCVMPYRERIELRIENLGPKDTHVSGALYTRPWSWDERSLHFGARWIAPRGPAKLAIEGQGVLLGILRGGRTLEARLDARALDLPPVLGWLDRAPFRERLDFELAAHAALEPARVAFFYSRPGARIESRVPRATDRELLLGDR